MRGRTLGTEKPGARARGINAEQLQQLFLEMPEVAHGFFRDIKGAEVDDRAQERQVGGRIRGAFKDRQLEALQQPGNLNRGTVQALGHAD